MRRAWVFLIFLFVLLVPARAYTDANVTIKIKDSAPNLNPAQLNPGGTVTWRNDDNVSHEIEFTTEPGTVTVPANGSSQPRVTNQGFEYKIDNINVVFSVVVGGPPVGPPATPPPATTTTTAPPLTTTTTTLAPATTDTTATSSTTTSTTTTTTEPASESASALIPIGDSSSGGRSAALPWLTVSSIVVAGLAGLVYYLWWRSGEEPDEFTELTDLNEPMPDG